MPRSHNRYPAEFRQQMVDLVRVAGGYEERRVPVSARDLAVIAGISYDKRRLSQNQPTSIKGDSKKIEELIKKFQAISQQHQEQIKAAVVSEQ